MTTSDFNPEDIIRENINNPRIYGISQTPDGLILDRRYTPEAIATSGLLNPRTADLNIIGPDVLTIAPELALALGLPAITTDKV